MGNSSISIMGALRTILGVFPESRPSDFSPHSHCQDFREIVRFWCCCGWICLSWWVGFTGWNHIARDWSTPNVSLGLKKIRTKIIDPPSGEKTQSLEASKFRDLDVKKWIKILGLHFEIKTTSTKFDFTERDKTSGERVEVSTHLPWWNSGLYWFVHFRNLQSFLESPYIKNKPTKGNPTDPSVGGSYPHSLVGICPKVPPLPEKTLYLHTHPSGRYLEPKNFNTWNTLRYLTV